MPNALASDIDYTLYFPNKNPSISLEDQQAIAHYQKAGYLFGLCSGRPYSGVINLFDTIHPDFLYHLKWSYHFRQKSTATL